jgi:hypothetical protein
VQERKEDAVREDAGAQEEEQEEVETAAGEEKGSSPPTPLDPARFAAMEQSLSEEKRSRGRERDAMLREITKLRQRRQQDASGGAPPLAPSPPTRIPVEFDEQGQPYVSPTQLSQFLQSAATPTNPVQQFMGKHRRMAESIVLEDPVGRAKANTRFQEAYQALDEAVRYAQYENNVETPDIDSMMSLIEDSGLATKFINEYSDIASTPRDIEDFIQAAVSLNPRRYRRIIERISNTPGEEEAPATGGVSSIAERMSKKPVPIRKFGGSTVPKTKSRIDVLDEKSPFEWTDDDRKAFLREVQAIDEKQA